MKKIAILLGLLETATPAEIETSINELLAVKNSQQSIIDANANYALKVEQDAKLVDSLKLDKAQLEHALTTAEQLLLEKEAELNKALQFIADIESPALSTEMDIKLDEQMHELASELMAKTGVQVIYITSDLTAFYTKEDANKYAYDHKQKVFDFGETA